MNDLKGARALLNLPGHQSTACIVAEIDLETDRSYPDYTFKISDCDRSISLDFNFNSEAERENNLYKIDTLISVIREFRKGIVKMNKKREKADA
jgi:hypothetical protein